MKKKILFISPLPPPYYGSAISSELCLNILKASEEFEVFNIKLNYSKDVSDLGNFSTLKILGFFYVLKDIWRVMRRVKPDFVYFVPATFGVALFRDSIFLWFIRRFKNIELILHLRSQIREKEWMNVFKKFLIKRLLKSDKIILLGSELKDNLKSLVKDEKIFFLPNAISNTLSSEDYLEILKIRRTNKELNLLFLSNMLEFKGWFKLLETCKLLKDSNLKFKCHFVGGWPSNFERMKFNDYVSTNLLQDFVIHYGKLLDERKASIFKKADIFVFPTEFDACPRVIIEAMEYGIPIVSTPIGTIPSMVLNGETGFIVNNNTPKELFDQVYKLSNDKLREEMEMKSRERFLSKYTLKLYKEQFLSIILRQYRNENDKGGFGEL